jgi:chemotaxis protein CheZ
MTRTADTDLQQRLVAAERASQRLPDPSAITAVVESVLSSLSGDISTANLKLYQELEELSRVIEAAKRDIAAVQPHDIRDWHIPMATDELGAVVAATAEATGAILDAAEKIERRAESMPTETKAAVAHEVTRIYEACNFQDITGQRITKVVNTLTYIETKIDALLAAFGPDMATPPASAAPQQDALVNGPQLPAAANSQDDIDAILASLE